jgi:hypothetical protein
MDAFICITCGTQYAPTPAPPAACIICDEERQFVPPSGQAWTTLKRLERSHMPTFRDEAGLIGIGIAPVFGINQRALLVPTEDSNVLWDCVSLVSDVMVNLIKGVGGLKAVAISHPHYYTTMAEWSRAFGGIPVYLHAADREWIMNLGDRGIDAADLGIHGETEDIISGRTPHCTAAATTCWLRLTRNGWLAADWRQRLSACSWQRLTGFGFWKG